MSAIEIIPGFVIVIMNKECCLGFFPFANTRAAKIEKEQMVGL